MVSISVGCIVMRRRSKFTSTKSQVTKKLGQMDKNMAKNCHLYASISQKLKLRTVKV